MIGVGVNVGLGDGVEVGSSILVSRLVSISEFTFLGSSICVVIC
jgi:hypothetical protein